MGATYLLSSPPSESSVIKRVAYEPLYLAHLRDAGVRVGQVIVVVGLCLGLRLILASGRSLVDGLVRRLSHGLVDGVALALNLVRSLALGLDGCVDVVLGVVLDVCRRFLDLGGGVNSRGRVLPGRAAASPALLPCHAEQY